MTTGLEERQSAAEARRSELQAERRDAARSLIAGDAGASKRLDALDRQLTAVGRELEGLDAEVAAELQNAAEAERQRQLAELRAINERLGDLEAERRSCVEAIAEHLYGLRRAFDRHDAILYEAQDFRRVHGCEPVHGGGALMDSVWMFMRSYLSHVQGLHLPSNGLAPRPLPERAEFLDLDARLYSDGCFQIPVPERDDGPEEAA